MVVAVLAAGCSSGAIENLSFPPPPLTSASLPAPAPTLPPGLAAQNETPVAGVTTTTAPLVSPGPASINGTVTGPQGPVAGATVEADRFVGDASAPVRTQTAADGTWAFRGVLGGQYRIRAWLAPDLDMETPVSVFVVAGQPQTVSLQVASYADLQLQTSLAPAAPAVGQPTNLAVQVNKLSIDANGVLAATPVADAPVLLVNGSGWQVNNGNPLLTDAAGQAVFEVECTAVGSDPLAAQAGSDPPVALKLPSCAPPPTTTTTLLGPGVTSTTCPTTPPGDRTTTTVLAFGQC